MADFIETYVEVTSKVPSPEIYRLWSAITAVSGVMERKAWSEGGAGPVFPNIFTILVGPPASGKDNAINPIRELWSKMQGLHLSPDNLNKATLVKALSESLRTVLNGADTPYIFSSMSVSAPEFGVFFPHYDLEFLSVINDIYLCRPFYQEERIGRGTIKIEKPHMVILSGTQPDYLNAFLPEVAWGMGFTSRLIMIYADSAPPTDFFTESAIDYTSSIEQLKKIFALKGRFMWSRAALEEVNAWNRAGGPPTPEHSRLLHYNGRRTLNVVKLSMISAVSRSQELYVTVDDFERARDWLLDAEAIMPDIFRAMGQKSDQQILADLHLHLYRLWSSVALDKRKPIKTKDIYDFLHTKVTSDKIAKLIDVAEKLGYIRKGQFPDEWVPRTLDHFRTM